MTRRFLFAAVLALAGCGGSSSSLDSITPKAFSYWSVDPAAPADVELIADGCPTVDATAVHATLDGKPLTLAQPGGRDALDDGHCEPPFWTGNAPTPDEEQTELVISDASETVHLTFIELARPPTPTLASAQLMAGQSLHFRLDSKHLQDRITRVRFQPSGGAEQVWPIDFLAQDADGSYDLPVPADAPIGDGTLVFDVTSDIAAQCEGDVDCSDDRLAVDQGVSSTISSANLTTAPVQVAITN